MTETGVSYLLSGLSQSLSPLSPAVIVTCVSAWKGWRNIENGQSCKIHRLPDMLRQTRWNLQLRWKFAVRAGCVCSLLMLCVVLIRFVEEELGKKQFFYRYTDTAARDALSSRPTRSVTPTPTTTTVTSTAHGARQDTSVVFSNLTCIANMPGNLDSDVIHYIRSEHTVSQEKSGRRVNKTTLPTSPQQDFPNRLQVVPPFQGLGLGNRLFLFASLLGLADYHHVTPVFTDGGLAQMFKISYPVSPRVANTPGKWFVRREKKPSAYDPTLKDLPRQKDLKITGYLQSWKYFSNIENTIRQQLTFSKNFTRIANAFLEKSVRQIYGGSTARDDVIVVGVHVRRGDMLSYTSKGYKVAPESYLKRAVCHFQTALHGRKLLFVVCSNRNEASQNWTRDHLADAGVPLSFSPYASPIVDLAVLSLCDHIIQTVGSFSWWGAWLSGGASLYYKDYPRPKSSIAAGFVARDYYLPQWRGLV